MLTPGRHHQLFQFGDLNATAHNLASIDNCSLLDTASEVYELSTNITNSLNYTCFNVTANDIILDCKGHIVDGIDDGYGVYAEAVENITIRNCTFTEWGDDGTESGIYFTQVGNSTIEEVNVSFNENGIYLDSSSNRNNIAGVLAVGNSGYGMFVTGSSYNTIRGLTATGGSYGLRLETSSNYNNVSDVIVSSAGVYGVILSSVYYNTFENVTANFVAGRRIYSAWRFWVISQPGSSGSAKAGLQELCPTPGYSVYLGLPPAFLIAAIMSRERFTFTALSLSP